MANNKNKSLIMSIIRSYIQLTIYSAQIEIRESGFGKGLINEFMNKDNKQKDNAIKLKLNMKNDMFNNK